MPAAKNTIFKPVQPFVPPESYHYHRQSYQHVSNASALNYRHRESGGHRTSHKLPPVIEVISGQFYFFLKRW